MGLFKISNDIDAAGGSGSGLLLCGRLCCQGQCHENGGGQPGFPFLQGYFPQEQTSIAYDVNGTTLSVLKGEKDVYYIE